MATYMYSQAVAAKALKEIPLDTIADGPTPPWFIPYESVPYLSPTTIRNVNKALRNNEVYVDVHFKNSHLGQAQIDQQFSNTAPVHASLFNLFILGRVDTYTDQYIDAQIGLIETRASISLNNFWHKRDEYTTRWTFAAADTCTSAYLREYTVDLLKKIKQMGASNALKSINTPFKVRVRVDWFITQVHITITRLNRMRYNRIQTVYYGNSKYTSQVYHDYNQSNTNYSRGAFNYAAPSGGYAKGRALRRNYMLEDKVSRRNRLTYVKFPSYLLNFTYGINKRDLKEIRDRFLPLKSAYTSITEWIGLLWRADDVISGPEFRNQFSVSAPKILEKTGFVRKCVCCDKYEYKSMVQWVGMRNVERYNTILTIGRNLFASDNHYGDYYARSTDSLRRIYEDCNVDPRLITPVPPTTPAPVNNGATLVPLKSIPSVIVLKHKSHFAQGLLPNPQAIVTTFVDEIGEIHKANSDATITPPPTPSDAGPQPLSNTERDVLINRAVLHFDKHTEVNNTDPFRWATETPHYGVFCSECFGATSNIINVALEKVNQFDPRHIQNYGNRARPAPSDSPLKYFFGPLTYFGSKNHANSFLENSRHAGTFSGDRNNEHYVIKNYTTDALNFVPFHTAKGERATSGVVDGFTAQLHPRGGPRTVISRSLSTPQTLDTTCYLGVELEVTTHQRAFLFARDLLAKACGTTGITPTAEDIKTLGCYIAASSVVGFQNMGKQGIVKSDATTGDCGFEIVSAPGTYRWHTEEAWKGFFVEDFDDKNPARAFAPSNWLQGWTNTGKEVMGKHPWDLSDATTPIYRVQKPLCGIHIHVSRNALTMLQLGKIVQYVGHNEAGFVEAVAGRPANSYTSFKPKKVTDGVVLNKPGQYVVGSNTSYFERSEAVNLTGSRGTIEFRMFRSNVSKAGFFKCIDFVQAVVDWTRDVSIQHLNNKHFIAFVMENRGKYPWLSKWLIAKNYADPTKFKPLNPKYSPEFTDLEG
jgi:hypothetical protein